MKLIIFIFELLLAPLVFLLLAGLYLGTWVEEGLAKLLTRRDG